MLDSAFTFSVPFSVKLTTYDAVVTMRIHASFNLRATAKPDESPAGKGDVPVSFYKAKSHHTYIPWFARGASVIKTA